MGILKARLKRVHSARLVFMERSKLVMMAVGGLLGSSIVVVGISMNRRDRLGEAMSRSACQTLATDPEPPLNVRSSPVVAPDNIVGTVQNGVVLTVIDENEGWLRISHPVQGWVYKQRTAVSCAKAPSAAVSLSQRNSAQSKQTTKTADEGTRLLTAATEQYHMGNLSGAIALARTIPPNHPVYALGQEAIVRWQQDWRKAESGFYTMQSALNEGRWQAVLDQVSTYPDNRFWRQRLTPLVRQAIQQQHVTKNKAPL